MINAQKWIDAILSNPESFFDETYDINEDHMCLGFIYNHKLDSFRICNQLCKLKEEKVKELSLHEEYFNNAEYRL